MEARNQNLLSFVLTVVESYFRRPKIIVVVALGILTMLMLAPGLASRAVADYYWITNPIFGEGMDSWGGAWDGYKGYQGIDLLSGNWRSNLRIGDNQAWIDYSYFFQIAPDTTTPVPGGVGSIISTLSNTATTPYGLPAGAVTIRMQATMVPETTHLGLRDWHYVISEPWVMKQSYTIKNTSSATLDDIAFYQYYFPSPYGWYPTNIYPSHVDYTAGIQDPIGYTFDITLYGEGDPHWAYTGLSTNISPTTHDVGHAGGYPDPPYFYPSYWRPSAISTDVLRQVENDTFRGWSTYDAPSGSDPNAVAGAFKWYIGSLDPGASYTITFLESVAPKGGSKIRARYPVPIDIKPQSCPNPFNMGSQGVVPVAILGTENFDVMTIDPATVMLEGVVPLRWNFEDVSTPVEPGADTCECTTEGPDGYVDMTLKFDHQAIETALGTVQDGEVRVLTLTGMTYDSIPIQGKDCIRIIDKGKPRLTVESPNEFCLGNNYPNPFNPATTISFNLPNPASWTLSIYNVAGQLVRTFEGYSSGQVSVIWNGKDNFDNEVASGIYFYKLSSGDFTATKKMVLTK